jgi:hypothetical protein
MATLAKLYPILKDLGLEDQKANEFVEIIDQSRKEGLATKEDIKDLEIRFKEDIKDLEIRLVKWIIGLMIAQTSITFFWKSLKIFVPAFWFFPQNQPPFQSTL